MATTKKAAKKPRTEAGKKKPQSRVKPATKPRNPKEVSPSGNGFGPIDIPAEDRENLDKLSQKIAREAPPAEPDQAADFNEPPPSPPLAAEMWMTDDIANIGVDMLHFSTDQIVNHWGKRINPYNPDQREKLRSLLRKQADKINMPDIVTRYMPIIEPFIVIGIITKTNLADIEPKPHKPQESREKAAGETQPEPRPEAQEPQKEAAQKVKIIDGEGNPVDINNMTMEIPDPAKKPHEISGAMLN